MRDTKNKGTEQEFYSAAPATMQTQSLLVRRSKQRDESKRGASLSAVLVITVTAILVSLLTIQATFSTRW